MQSIPEHGDFVWTVIPNNKPTRVRRFAFVASLLGCAQRAARASRLGKPCGALLIKTIFELLLFSDVQKEVDENVKGDDQKNQHVMNT
jgi:hypothetical protein